jgi:hypothetical protein
VRRSSASAVLAAVLAVAVVGGCGSETASSSESASQPSADEPTSALTPSEPPGESSEPAEPEEQEAVTVAISIAGGEVDPAGKQVEATVGQTVVLVVDSDAAEELHVHSAPDDHEFAIEPGQNQTFRFPVEQPGQFDIETHDTGVLVAQLVVRP